MLFRKIGCLAGSENWVKLKMFSVLTVKQEQWGRKYFLSLFSLQIISGDAQRNKGLTDAQTQRERAQARAHPQNPDHASPQPSSDHASPLPRSRAGQTPKTHKHRSTQISAHPSLIIDPPLRSLAMHRRAPILTTDCRQCSTRLSNTLAATTDRRSGRHRPPAHSTPPPNPPDLTTAASIHYDSLFSNLFFPQSFALSSPSH